jgi:hypothetical protein
LDALDTKRITTKQDAEVFRGGSDVKLLVELGMSGVNAGHELGLV